MKDFIKIMAEFINALIKSFFWVTLIAVLCFVLIYYLNQYGIQLEFHQIKLWIMHNLSYSIFPFSFVIVIFVMVLFRLHIELSNLNKAKTERVIHYDQLSDIFIGIFFGIGVIWTAIGMRDALISALSGLDRNTVMEQGALLLLKKLVDGGIVNALSTTIVGGVGGYGLKLIKIIMMGKRIQQFYLYQNQQEQRQLYDQLETISSLLEPTSGNAEQSNLIQTIKSSH